VLKLFFFFSKIVSFMRKFGKNIVQPVRPQMTILRMRIACWITKDTDALRVQGVAIKKPDCFYYSFPATSMTKRRVGH